MILGCRDRAVDQQMSTARDKQKHYYDMCVGVIGQWCVYDALGHGSGLHQISHRYITNTNHLEDYDFPEHTGVRLFVHSNGNFGDYYDEEDLIRSYETQDWREQVWYKMLYKHFFGDVVLTDDEEYDLSNMPFEVM